MQAEVAPQLLATQQQRLAAMGFTVTTAMPMGVPGPELLALAHAQGCHFLVIRSHGHSLVREFVFGGVATDVIHRADLPVLVLRMVSNEVGGGSHCRIGAGAVGNHLLYATDFSETSERAFGYVESLVQREYQPEIDKPSTISHDACYPCPDRLLSTQQSDIRWYPFSSIPTQYIIA